MSTSVRTASLLRIACVVTLIFRNVIADYGDSIRFPDVWNDLLLHWDEPFEAADSEALAQKASAMFDHSYTSYLAHGFPSDNVTPKTCKPEDVQGGVAITLLDSLDALLIFNRPEEFRKAEALMHNVSFDRPERTHVFEVTIRALGGLLSAHIATLNNPALVPEYAGTFLHKAEDLARRLMPAFDTSTGIPISWVNLRSGKVDGHEQDTCVACTTTLAIEFRMLSVLTGNATYGDKVDAAVREIFSRRHPGTGFVGNSIRTDTGAWHRTDAGIGPGIDSYYEYLLKMYLIFGDEQYLNMFVDQFVRVQQQATTPGPWGGFEWVLDVGMHGGGARTQYIASLTAFWPGLQASIGLMPEAFPLMQAYTRAQIHHGWLPERIHGHLKLPHATEKAWPLRPELLESAYILHSQLGAPRYLRLAQGILETLEQHNRCECGYCAVADVHTGTLEDSMESFFLAETLKYMYLLLKGAAEVTDFFVFTTEAHLMPVLPTAATAESVILQGPPPGPPPGAAAASTPADDDEDEYYDPPEEEPSAEGMARGDEAGGGGSVAVGEAQGADTVRGVEDDEYYDPPEEGVPKASGGSHAVGDAAAAAGGSEGMEAGAGGEDEDEYYDPPEVDRGAAAPAGTDAVAAAEPLAADGATGSGGDEADDAHESSGDANEEEILADVGGCEEVCDELPAGRLEAQAQAGQARFPGLTFDVAAAALLRQRRCRVCRAVRSRLAAFPAPPPCEVGKRLRISLDGCPKPEPPKPRPKTRESDASVKTAAKADPAAEYKRALELLGALRKTEGRLAEELAADLESKWAAHSPYVATRAVYAVQPAAGPAECSPAGECSAAGAPGAGVAAGEAQAAEEEHVMVAYGLCVLTQRVLKHKIGCSSKTIVPAAGVPASLLPMLLPHLLPARVLVMELWVNRLSGGEECGSAGECAGPAEFDLDDVVGALPVHVTWKLVERYALWDTFAEAMEEFGAEGDPRQVANDMINTQVMPYAHYWLMGNRRYLHAARHYTIPA